jgi:hypothetical protein
LQLVEEPDLVRKADLASELAQQLGLATVLLAAGDQDEQAAGAEVAQTLGALVDQGVTENLNQAVKASQAGRNAEIEQIRQRADQATAILERNLAKAPAEAQPGLTKALQASKKGWNRPGDPPGSKGKKKFEQSGQPFVPYGQQKKAGKS